MDASAPEFWVSVAGVDRSPANPGGEADARSLAGLRRVRRGDGARCARVQWRQVQFTEDSAKTDRGAPSSGGATLPPTGLPGPLVVGRGLSPEIRVINDPSYVHFT